MANFAGAVVNKADGAGTVTAIVSCMPLASVTLTLAVPPAVAGKAAIVKDVGDPAGTVALTKAGLELAGV